MKDNAMHTGKLTVMVLAVGGNVSQGILKALRRSSLPLRTVGTDVSPDQMGLYTVDSGHVVPWASDPAFLPEVARICRTEKVDILLTGCEPILDWLVRNRAAVEAETGALCPVNTPEVHDIGEDKLLTCQWLLKNGFNVPRFAAVDGPAAVRAMAKEPGYPLIAKPRRGGGARGLILVENGDDLEYVLRRPGYLVQECLGDDDGEYTVGCFCDRDNQVAGSIVMRRHLLAGTTYRAWVEDHPEVRREAEGIAAALGAVGPCNIQLRMTPRGPVCFEINPRFSGTTPLRAAFGFNEVEAFLRHFVLGEPVTLPRVTKGVALRYWNELYVPDAARQRLVESGRTDGPLSGPDLVEPYGVLP